MPSFPVTSTKGYNKPTTMSKHSKESRLEQLRKDAVAKGVLEEAVCPKKPSSEMQPQPHKQNKSSDSPPPLRAPRRRRRRKNVARPVLHPRPHYVYGDAYTPAYETTTKIEAYRKQNKKGKHKLPKIQGKKCETCADDTDKVCAGLTPSSAGPAFANKVLAARAIQSSGRRERTVWPSIPFSHETSSLSKSFTADDVGELSDDPDESEIPTDTDTSDEDDLVTVCSSDDDVFICTPLGRGIFNTKDGAGNRGDCDKFWASLSCVDLPNVSSEFKCEIEQEIITVIEGPMEPAWEKDDYVLRVDERFLNPTNCQEPEGNRSANHLGNGDEEKPVQVAPRKVAFAPLPSIQRSLPNKRRSVRCGPDNRDGRKIRTGWHRLRSYGIELFKRNSVLDAISLARKKLKKSDRA